MRFTIDNDTYEIHMIDIMAQLESGYDSIRDTPLVLPDGNSMDISAKSFKRTALSLAATPIVYPILRTAFKVQNVPIPEYDKKTDFMDYAILCILRLIGIICDKKDLYAQSTKDDVTGFKVVTAIASTSSNTGNRTGNEQVLSRYPSSTFKDS